VSTEVDPETVVVAGHAPTVLVEEVPAEVPEEGAEAAAGEGGEPGAAGETGDTSGEARGQTSGEG
jgi:hypothetical protein